MKVTRREPLDGQCVRRSDDSESPKTFHQQMQGARRCAELTVHLPGVLTARVLGGSQKCVEIRSEVGVETLLHLAEELECRGWETTVRREQRDD